LQPIKDGEVCSVISDGENSIESGVKLPEINDPQKLGSAITYFRRYTLQSLLSLQAEDDDGNMASGMKPKLTNEQFEVVMKSDRQTALKAIKKAELSADQLSKLKSKFNI
jgi:hypothetical protein